MRLFAWKSLGKALADERGGVQLGNDLGPRLRDRRFSHRPNSDVRSLSQTRAGSWSASTIFSIEFCLGGSSSGRRLRKKEPHPDERQSLDSRVRATSHARLNSTASPALGTGECVGHAENVQSQPRLGSEGKVPWFGELFPPDSGCASRHATWIRWAGP